jgi:hypothetical protein
MHREFSDVGQAFDAATSKFVGDRVESLVLGKQDNVLGAAACLCVRNGQIYFFKFRREDERSGTGAEECAPDGPAGA